MYHYSFKVPLVRLKSSKAFSLLEVLLAVAILSSGIVLIFRSFTSSLASARFSQNITQACLLTETILWKAEDKQKYAPESLEPENGVSFQQGRNFSWSFEFQALASVSLDKLGVQVSWPEKTREKPYHMEYITYAVTRQ